MLLQVILEGLGLGALLVLVCAAGIRKGAVGMVHLYPMGQPFASIQSGLYVRLQRPERPFRQRLFPVSRQGRGQQDENADREDRIWRQAMKILVYGAGVLGCNLARNLLRAGKDVTLLARGNWAAEIKQNGLRIKDKFSLRTSVSRIPVVTELAPDAMYDVIFVVLRYTQLDSVLDTLRANRTKNIVFVGNNVQARVLAAALPEKNVLFAFALSAGHREADRVLSIDLKKITIGQLTGATSNKQLIGRIFHGTKYKVVYEPNMEDYLLCHAAFVMPAAFACYKTDGDLKKLRGDTAYLNRVLDANIEGYRAIRDAGHTILPKEDADFEGEKYRKTCLRFFKLMCATSLGKLCASDHAMNAIDEMSALNRDLKKFFDEHGAAYPVWQALETEAGRYLQ